MTTRWSSIIRKGLAVILFFLCSLGVSGCLSASIAGDMRRVREIARTEHLAHVEETEIDPAMSEDIVRLLERPLDADTAARIALLNNRELRATLREVGITRGQVIQAGLLPNPTLEAELLPERNTEIELRLEYDLTEAILAPMMANALEPVLDAERYRSAKAVIEVSYQAKVAFYRLQFATQRLAISQRQLDGYVAARDAARAMFDAGNIPELGVALRETDYERARVAVALLELDVASERENVQRLLGLHAPDTAWSVGGELRTTPARLSIPDGLETKTLSTNLDLIEAQRRLESLALQTGVARTEGWLPDISVDVHTLQGNPNDASEGSDWRFGGGLSIGLPVFNQNEGTTAALQAEFDAQLERYYGLAMNLRSVTRATRNQLVSAHGRALQYQEVILPAQRKITELTLLQYNAMQVGIFQLLQARQDELQMQLAHLETLRDYWISAAALDALLAGALISSDAPSPIAASGYSSSAPAGGH